MGVSIIETQFNLLSLVDETKVIMVWRVVLWFEIVKVLGEGQEALLAARDWFLRVGTGAHFI